MKELQKQLCKKSLAELGKCFGVSLQAIQGWMRRPVFTAKQTATVVARARSASASGAEVVEQLRKQLDKKSIAEVGECFGVSLQAIQGWRKRPGFTAKQAAKMVALARSASARASQENAIRPLVEFFPIAKCKSKQGAKFELVPRKNSYLDGLRKELEGHHGVYLFFDSRGQAMYAGKAREQSLWKEMTVAFNRGRPAVQKIKRVEHPRRKRLYLSSNEKVRQIDEYAVPLHELASYFSAYKVDDGMIGDVEALLVRSFANDLLNIRMERFSHQKKRA